MKEMTGHAASFSGLAEEALPPGAGLSRELVNWLLVFADDLPLLYAHNNKAACSTVKHSLLQSIVPPEQITRESLDLLTEGPFATRLFAYDPPKRETVLQRPAFTVVRNPYTRALSGYLDKVHPGDPIGRAFYRRFLLAPDPERRIGFDQFLRCLASDHPRRSDEHFAPQYVNTMAHHIDFDFIGSVEDMEGVAAYLRTWGIPLEPYAAHATNAAARLDAYYTDETEPLVEAIYAEDFRFFGYPHGLSRAHEPPSGPAPAARRGVSLREFAAAPARVAQPGTREIEAWRVFQGPGSRSMKREIAERALGFDDWRLVKNILVRMTESHELDMARLLMDRLIVLLTNHMDHVPERMLSKQGRHMKRMREEILRR